MQMWLNAIRLSIWERSRCNEIYTGTLIGSREPKPLGWQGYDAGLSTNLNVSPGTVIKNSNGTPKFEGYLKARLPGDTEWRRVFCTIMRGSNVPSRSTALGGSTSNASIGQGQEADVKKSRRSSLLPSFGKKKNNKEEDQVVIEDLPGDGQVSTIAFFAAPAGIDPTSRPGKKDQPICVAQHVFYGAPCSSLGSDQTTSADGKVFCDVTSLRPVPRNCRLDQRLYSLQDRGYFLDASRRLPNGMGSRRKVRETRVRVAHARIWRSRRYVEVDRWNLGRVQGDLLARLPCSEDSRD